MKSLKMIFRKSGKVKLEVTSTCTLILMKAMEIECSFKIEQKGTSNILSQRSFKQNISKQGSKSYLSNYCKNNLDEERRTIPRNYNDSTLDPEYESFPENEDLIRKIQKKIEARVQYKPKCKSLIYSFLCCKEFTRCCMKSLYKHHQDYKQASRKLTSDLDLKTLVNTIRRTQILADLLFSQSSAILLLENHPCVMFPPKEYEKEVSKIELTGNLCKQLALQIVKENN
ncbi:unnamed protein product [Moneuplotes crassus]|uniref:Uncharacterized protein n=1 Tax=Euplotes crassus TaxID=5936 RepID=A0AAD1U3S6_EUPCR|nr:unnamed protein product [Moneuplotes crassus]